MTVNAQLVAAQTRIGRPALAKRLNKALDAGCVLLVAGPGYGKTLALEEALERRHGRTAWLHCAEPDRDAGRLLRRLVAAVREAVPGTVDVFAEHLALATEQVAIGPASVEFISELDSHLIDPLAIVLDDAERLRDSRAATELVNDLLVARVERLRVAVATRSPLPFKLAKARSARRLFEFGPGELAFTPDECGALLRLDGPPGDEEDAERLFASTDGWPLGVALAAIHGDNPALHGATSRAELFTFLQEEVLAALPADLRQQALVASTPTELDEASMRALGLTSGFASQAADKGLLLRPVSSDHRWVAFHPLVREFLRERLAAEFDEQAVRELHARVAPALRDADRREEAIEHWLAAEAWGEAAATIAEVAPDVIHTAPDTVRRWLTALPDRVRARPVCLLLQGTLEWEEGHNPEAVELLRSAIRGFSAADDTAGEWLARFALIDPLELMGEWEHAISLADGFDEKRALEAGIVPPAVAAYAAAGLGALGRMDGCGALSRRILAHPHVGPLRPAQSVWESDMLILAGQLEQAVSGARKAVSEAEKGDPFNRLPIFSIFLANAITQQGRDREALAFWERVEQIASQRHMRYVVKTSHSWRALLHARNGRLDLADEQLAHASVLPGVSWREAVMETARARIAGLRGDAAEVASAADRALTLAERAVLTERLQAAVELAPALLEAGMLPRAVSLVDRHLQLLDTLVPGEAGRYFRALLFAVRAWLSDAQGLETDAFDDLRRMWLEAGSRNAADVVRREWRLLESLLWKSLEARVLDPSAVVDAIGTAWPGGERLLPFTAHPVPAARHSAFTAVAGSGHPELPQRLAELERDPEPELARAAKAAKERLRITPPPLAFTVLGDFRVRRGSWWVEDAAWDRRVAQRLVRYLLVNRGRAVSEDLLVEAFWPDAPDRSARQRLKVAVSCARAVLDIPGADSRIEAAERTLRLALRERDSVDADQFEQAAATALAEHGAEARGLLERAAALWTGEPLPQERYSDWATPWREQLTTQYAQVLAALAEHCHAERDAAAATLVARTLVELDPLDEAAQRLLITSYARAGRRAHALQQYLDCRRSLIDGLGVEPARETTELQQNILAGEAV